MYIELQHIIVYRYYIVYVYMMSYQALSRSIYIYSQYLCLCTPCS